jgi:hypothetical protein
VGRLITGTGTGLADVFHGHAILEVESEGRMESYWVTLHLDPEGHIAGLRLQKFATGQKYDLPADLDGCECPDHLYRNRECKHMVALRQALVAAAEAQKPHRPVDRKTERDELTAPGPDLSAIGRGDWLD